MSASVSGKKQCVKCNKGGGILICDGCQQPFCGKHVNEHRQELANQLDGIMQEHDLLQQELERSSDEHSLLQAIQKWEEESITTIRVAAEAARADLQQLIVESKDKLSNACRDIAKDLRSSREADDFSENDLNRWMEQLKVLQRETTSPSSIKLCEDKYSTIPLITIKHVTSAEKKPAKRNEFEDGKNLSRSSSQDRFWKVQGMIELYEKGFLAKHIGVNVRFLHILGQQLYSQGRHMIRFKLEQSSRPDDIYFGCISSHLTDDQIRHDSSFAVGWFGDMVLYQHSVHFKGAQSQDSKLKTNDIVCLTLDCDNEQIELFHERTNKTYEAQVNIDKSPFPWHFLIALLYKNDCVRILPK
jgi:hypothetical protein